MNSKAGPISFPGSLDSLSHIRSYVRDIAKDAGLENSATYSLILAADEIATNIILHGYEEAGLQGDITINVWKDDNSLVIELIDRGATYDPHGYSSQEDRNAFQREGGFGIMLAKSGVDELLYESTEGNNIHRLIKWLRPHSPCPILFKEVLDERQKLATLLRIAKVIGLETHLPALLKQIVAEVTFAMNAERTTLFLVDPDHPNQLISNVAEGVGAKKIYVSFGEGIAGITAKTMQTINVSDAYNDKRFNSAFDRDLNFKTRSILSAPVIDPHGSLIGVVQVINKTDGTAFTEKDEHFLNAICSHLQTAIKRATMVEQRIESELMMCSIALARKIQMGLIPKGFTTVSKQKNIDIHAAIIPAFNVGGDLYDYYFFDDDRICFIIGDVSDKGVPAALFMAMTHTAFNITSGDPSYSIALIMNKVNQFLCNNNPEQMFVTAFAGILDLQTGLIEYVDAGHEPPFIMRKTGQVERIPKTGGIVLGFIKEHNFLSGSLFLQPGDSIVLYTDGVSEAMNSERRPFGDKAIEKTLIRIGPNRGSREVVTAILSDLQSHVKGYRQSDDIATLVVRYLEPCN